MLKSEADDAETQSNKMNLVLQGMTMMADIVAREVFGIREKDDDGMCAHLEEAEKIHKNIQTQARGPDEGLCWKEGCNKEEATGVQGDVEGARGEDIR